MDAAERAERGAEEAADGVGGEARLMHMYSWLGQRSSVSNVTPIQTPPDPRPISVRAAK